MSAVLYVVSPWARVGICEFFPLHLCNWIRYCIHCVPRVIISSRYVASTHILPVQLSVGLKVYPQTYSIKGHRRFLMLILVLN